jgi:hypothetical protein
VQSLRWYGCVLSVLLYVCPVFGWAAERGLCRRHHPWGRFEVGAWRRVRVVSEQFGENETLTTSTETKTTLKKVESDGVTLLVETVVHVGGKQIRAEPQIVKQGWHGQLTHQNVEVTPLGSGQVTIQDRRIPCRTEQVALTGPTSMTLTRISYSDAVEPYILRQESTKTDLKGVKQRGQTTVEVVELGVPWRILANVRSTSVVKTVHRNGSGSAVTVARTSARVPGGEICSTTNKFDSSGHLIGRSRLELVDYGLASGERRTGLFRRRRPIRLRRLHRFSPYRPYEPVDGLD